jgi:hypothetical protein
LFQTDLFQTKYNHGGTEGTEKAMLTITARGEPFRL